MRPTARALLALAALAACRDPVAAIDDAQAARTPPAASAFTGAAWLDLHQVTAFADLTNPASITFTTYDGSRQVVHPDVVHLPSGWNGAPYWAVLTPYPGGDRHFENPSVYASTDGERWTIPPGVTNPVLFTRRGHLSDPDVVLDPTTGGLVLFYRESVLRNDSHSSDNIFRVASGDGVTWDRPRAVAASRNRFLVSPTVTIGPDGTWRMWAVDAGKDGCSAASTRVVLRTSASGDRFRRAGTAHISQPGYTVWHIDVQYIPSRQVYWALYAAYPAGTSCASTDLFLARSTDGLTWTTFTAPVLARTAVSYFSLNVYRSTFAYDEATDEITFWFSGARAIPVHSDDGGTITVPLWSAAIGRAKRRTVFMRIAARTPTRPNPSPTATQSLIPPEGTP